MVQDIFPYWNHVSKISLVEKILTCATGYGRSAYFNTSGRSERSGSAENLEVRVLVLVRADFLVEDVGGAVVLAGAFDCGDGDGVGGVGELYITELTTGTVGTVGREEFLLSKGECGSLEGLELGGVGTLVPAGGALVAVGAAGVGAVAAAGGVGIFAA